MMEAVACIIAGGQEAKTKMRLIQTAVVVLLMVSSLSAAKTLDMYVIDVEGGKALLLVSPSGQSMLLDAGVPGYMNNGRDANRIVEACRAAGVKKIDYMVVTHVRAACSWTMPPPKSGCNPPAKTEARGTCARSLRNSRFRRRSCL